MKEEFYCTDTNEVISDDGTMSTIAVIIIFITMSAVFLWGYDLLENESTLAVNIFLKADCDFDVPPNYKILFNGKYYVVQIPKESERDHDYLSGEMGNIENYPFWIRKPTKLWSECKARAYIKKYISQNKLIGFKEVNP